MNKDEFYTLIPKNRVTQVIRKTRLPAYLYFKEIIQKKYMDLSACLPKGMAIHYAFKANTNKEVLSALRSLGIGADVASGGELELSNELSYKAADVEFTGPGKTVQELSLAIDLGISSINVESISEIRKIINLCRVKNVRANVGIRVNPTSRPSSSAMKMGGDTQFGIAENDLEEAISIMKDEIKLLHFTGLHMHLGSQYMNAEKIVENYRFILEKALGIAQRCTTRIEKINFGGGWGIDMFGKKSPLNLTILKDGLGDLFADQKYKGAFSETKFIIEPGRFLVAECGIYACEVIYRKKGYSREFLIVDGGMHHHYAAAGGIGQVIRRNYEVDAIVESGTDGVTSKYTVAGSLCIPDDILATELDLDSLIKEGDILLFFNSGAYGFSASPLHFLSHPLPREI
ncbi:MAG TPA: pyridoxal-dependent decarboxylase, exosortase A system-associated, partial [Nitrospirota bacterium]|nr:pyridoxal-dependent decarboxylase, exosortase A system-associated [Nitrospirota bacterium]